MSDIIKIDGWVMLLDYQVTHGVLLFRSQQKKENGDKYNIDIFFYNVRYFEVETDLEDIIIKEGDADVLTYLTSRLSHFSRPPAKTYTIHSGEKVYYVLADEIQIKENTLDLITTSIKWHN